jgi:hypothetical protein
MPLAIAALRRNPFQRLVFNMVLSPFVSFAIGKLWASIVPTQVYGPIQSAHASMPKPYVATQQYLIW